MGVVRSHFVIDEQGKVIEARYNVKPAESPTLSMKALTG
jgi:peroxiredoxin